MTKVISFDIFDEVSIEKALKQTEAYTNELQKRTEEFVRRLAWIGAEQASASYADGSSEGNDSVRVTVEEAPEGAYIVASGEDVYFLEFGTGIMAGDGYDTSVITPPVDISSGSWSRTKGTGEFEKYGSWHHDGQKYTFTIPRKGLYFAIREIERQYKQVADEVFSS